MNDETEPSSVAGPSSFVLRPSSLVTRHSLLVMSRSTMPNLRLAAAIAAGKAAGLASRALGAGGGTTMPGVVARRIAPDALRLLSAGLPQGVVLVGGTNGKTTTTRMLAAILAEDGRRVLHNRAGANLVTGLTAT